MCIHRKCIENPYRYSTLTTNSVNPLGMHSVHYSSRMNIVDSSIPSLLSSKLKLLPLKTVIVTYKWTSDVYLLPRVQLSLIFQIILVLSLGLSSKS